MKRFVLFVVILLANVGAFAQKNSSIENGQCLIFNGSIDKYPITFIFQIWKDQIEGHYYYKKTGVPIPLKGNSNDSGYTFETLYGTSNETEKFTLRIFHNELFGKWNLNGKELAVNLVRTTNPINIYRLHKKLKAEEILTQQKKTFDPEKFYQEAELIFTFLWPEGADKKETFIRETQFTQLQGFQIGAEDASAIRFDEPTDPRTVNGNPTQMLQLMQRISDTFFAEFTKMVLDAHKETNDYLTNQSLSLSNNYRFDSDKFTVIETNGSEYTGGAHGMYYQYHNTWSHEQQRAVGTDQLLNKKQLKKLPKAMTQNFKIARGIPQKESLDQHGFWIKEFESEGGNTYFTDLGVHTSFGLYEIAPYSEGIIEVFVPWKDLK